MRKALGLFAFFITIVSSSFAEAPKFNDGKAYVIEKSSVSKKIRDKVKIVNCSSESDFQATFYGFDEAKNEWIFYGSKTISGSEPKTTIRSVNDIEINLRNYNYYALKIDSDKSFRFTPFERNHDLYISICDDFPVDESKAFFIDVKSMGKFQDNVEFIGYENLLSAASFKVVCWNNEDESDKIETFFSIGGPDDSDGTDEASTGARFKKFRYFRIISLENKDFKYSVAFKHDDMKITVYEAQAPKWQKVIPQPGISKKTIYEGILQGCVIIFNKSTYVIEYKDLESGIIKGKATYYPYWNWTPFDYVFTFEAKEGRYRITFDNLEYRLPNGTKKFFNKTACDIVFPKFEEMVEEINAAIKKANTDEDW